MRFRQLEASYLNEQCCKRTNLTLKGHDMLRHNLVSAQNYMEDKAVLSSAIVCITHHAI